MTRQLRDATPEARASVLATARDFLLRNSADRAGSVCDPEVMAKVLRNEVIAEVDFGAINFAGLRTSQDLNGALRDMLLSKSRPHQKDDHADA
jgi:hypothetical protein